MSHIATPPATKPRYLQVGVRLGEQSATVESVRLVAGVPAQLLAGGHPIVSVVDFGGQVRHVARFLDPRISRSTRRDERGDHHTGPVREGIIEVSVPFVSITDLSQVHIVVADLSASPVGTVDAAELARLIAERQGAPWFVHEFGFAQIRATPSWTQVAQSLGISAETGSFEIFLDHDQLYRWRLRKSGGEIVAVASQGFRTRAECESELDWVRHNAALAPVISMNPLPG
jgi:uncharacterized protein YegP (UPF0339 family)